MGSTNRSSIPEPLHCEKGKNRKNDRPHDWPVNIPVTRNYKTGSKNDRLHATAHDEDKGNIDERVLKRRQHRHDCPAKAHNVEEPLVQVETGPK